VRLVSVASIMAQARQACDRVGSPVPTDAELLLAVNLAWTGLYNNITQAYGQDYYWATYSFQTVSAQADYALPALFFKMRFIDQSQGGQSRTAPVLEYDEALRDSYLATQILQGGQTITLSYNPIAQVLSQYANSFLASNNGVDGLTMTAVTAGPYGNAIQVNFQTPAGGGTIAVTSLLAGVITVTITPPTSATLGTVVNQINNVANWPNSYQLFTASGSPNLADGWTITTGAVPLGGTTQADFINGFEEYLIAKGAAYIMKRLQRDYTPFEQDAARLYEQIQDNVAVRDVGSPLVAKDYQQEQQSAAMAWFFGGTTYRLSYRIQGQNLHLIPTPLQFT
jgi:hypothetical protein